MNFKLHLTTVFRAWFMYMFPDIKCNEIKTLKTIPRSTTLSGNTILKINLTCVYIHHGSLTVGDC